MQHRIKRILATTALCSTMFAIPALGAEVEPSAEANEKEKGERAVRLKEVTVSATRSAESINAIPGAVTVIESEKLQEQLKVTRDLGDALGKLVPGLGAPTHSQSLSGQTLRGRKVLVLIDGIPQNVIRDGLRNLTTIHPSAVERIEVLPGASSIYGESAAGGIINIITRAPGEGAPVFTTDLGFNFSASHPSDSMGGSLRQALEGRKGKFDYSLSGSFERTGGYFDARGDRIPPDVQGNLSDSNNYNLFGKVGADLGGQKRLQLSVNHYNLEQDTDYIIDPAVKSAPAGTRKARAKGGLSIDDQQGTENTLVSVDYNQGDFLGSRVHGQLYYRDYMTRFGPSDSRNTSTVKNIIQSRLESEKIGSRLEIDSPLPAVSVFTPKLLWGVDYSEERTSQPVSLFAPADFDASGGTVFTKTGERLWVPTIKPKDLGLFAQLEVDVASRLVIRGGVRHERVRADVPGFTTLVGNSVNGGELKYDDTLFNAGAVLYLTDAVSVFANFSQGFSLTDIGLFLRQAPAGYSVADSNLLDAQKVDSYEVGVRGEWSKVQAAFTAFYNESEMGLTIKKVNDAWIPTRAPEQIYGFDASIDVQPAERWRLGGMLGWSEGENEVNGDSRALDGTRIQPLKVTGYVEHETVPARQWRNRLQVLYSGARDRAYDDLGPTAYGGREVHSYYTVDLVSSLKLGPGSLSLGVENLLNRQYYPVTSQLMRTGDNTSFFAARGAVVNVGYSVSY